MVKSIIFFIALLLSFSVEAQDAEQVAQENNIKTMTEYENLPEVEIRSIQSYLQPFVYNEDQMRNPFIHPELAIPLKPGSVYGPFLPLQEFKLSQLKVNGLFWNTSRPKAIISTPRGKTYDIGIKDFIGENFGYVASIREKEVVIIQTLEDQGQRYTTTKVLFLAD